MFEVARPQTKLTHRETNETKTAQQWFDQYVRDVGGIKKARDKFMTDIEMHQLLELN